MVVPQIIHFNRVFHYKPSILGYPYFWNPPNVFNLLLYFVSFWNTHWFLNSTGLNHHVYPLQAFLVVSIHTTNIPQLSIPSWELHKSPPKTKTCLEDDFRFPHVGLILLVSWVPEGYTWNVRLLSLKMSWVLCRSTVSHPPSLAHNFYAFSIIIHTHCACAGRNCFTDFPALDVSGSTLIKTHHAHLASEVFDMSIFVFGLQTKSWMITIPHHPCMVYLPTFGWFVW